jgi:hypothetical protein
MQYVEGGTLRDRIRQPGAIGEREARRVLGQVAAALDAAHRRGLVHRDIKPANILIEAESGHAYVADFGLTAALATGDIRETTQLTKPGELLGTPVYMSPEQAASEQVGPKSDLYSFGMLAYELLTGELPFTARTALAWATAHLRDTPSSVKESRPDLTSEIVQLVDRCLAKQPEDRPRADEVARCMLPSLETEVEWPPPGLRSLQGRAHGLIRVVITTAAAGVVFSLALAFPPESVQIEGNWWQRFEALSAFTDSALGVRRESPEGVGSPWLWHVALLAGLAAFATGLAAVVVSAFRVVTRIAFGRTRGWRWDTLIDVAADADGRNGLLISGSREFAALQRVCRLEVLRARRFAAAAPLAGGLWVIGTLGLWALFLVLGIAVLDGTGPVMSPAVLLLVVLPGLFAVGVGAAEVLRESRLLRPLPRRRAHTGTLASAATGSSVEEVTAWYASLPQPGEALATAGRWLKLAGAVVCSVSALAGLLAVLALSEVAAAVWVAGRVVQRLGPQTAELARTIDRIASEDPLGTARGLMQPYMPPGEAVEDSTWVPWAHQLLSAGPERHGVASYASSPAYPLVNLAGSRIADAFSEARGALSPDTLRLLEALADHPRTVLFRRLAGTSEIDLFAAALERPLADYESLAQLPSLAYPRIGEGGRANAWASVLDVAHGEDDSAARRLGENAAFAEHLLRVPSGFANRYAMIMLQELALVPLAELEELRGAREAAERLRAVAARSREELLADAWSSHMAGLITDPSGSPHFWQALRDTRVPVGHRVASLEGVWQGYCANPREIVSGLSAARRLSFAAVVGLLSEVPHVVELAEIAKRAWERRLGSGSSDGIRLGEAADDADGGLLRRLRICGRDSQISRFLPIEY